MRKFLYILILSNIINPVIAESTIDSLLNVLDNTIQKRDYYIEKKTNRIKLMNEQHNKIKSENVNLSLYNLYNDLCMEYESFINDSAFLYAEKLKSIAILLKSNPHSIYARTKLAFILLSSGLFKETLDTLNNISVSGMPDTIKSSYYFVKARTYFDLADFTSNNSFSERYNLLGNQHIDSAINLVENTSFLSYSYRGLKYMKSRDFEKARQTFEFMIKNYKMPDHEMAIEASSLGYTYLMLGYTDKSIEMLIIAAISDIKSSTKETVALRNLSELLYKKGDLKRAYKYIKIAHDDAVFYNSRLRKIQVSNIMPLIEGEELNSSEKQKKILFNYSAILSALSFIVLIFIFITLRQLKKLKEAKLIIETANRNLIEINNKLLEANKIKDEYIGHFFTVNSDYIEKIGKFQKAVNRKLLTGRLDDVKSLFNNIDLKKERDELFMNFDKVFLKLFPDFIEKFNALFNEEDKIYLEDNELLNTDLRIFALIRLGIYDNEKIAKFLEYSVNTIYTYKTKIKNKSIIPNELFDDKIMGIKAI